MLLNILENSLGREKNRALTTDKPGAARSRFSGAFGMHSLSGEKNPHEDAAVQFAKRLGHYLNKEEHTNKFDDLLIAAEPKMMGRIRAALGFKLSERVKWFKKDLCHLTADEIRKRHLAFADF